jgi:hypothetical protein
MTVLGVEHRERDEHEEEHDARPEDDRVAMRSAMIRLTVLPRFT